MTPSQQIQDNTRKIIELTKAPLVDTLQECQREKSMLIATLKEIQEGIYSHDASLEAKNFVYRITSEAIAKATNA